MTRFFAVTAALFGLMWVALRAVGSHAWQFDAQNLMRFEQGTLMLIVHALVLLIVAQAQSQRFLPMRLYAGVLFLLGICLFSGSLICLSVGGPGFLSRLAPIGGVSLMLGWLCLAVANLKRPAAGKI
jgi:uncharacterized membrane protein YgdD (TMEM256/DUF423 family)